MPGAPSGSTGVIRNVMIPPKTTSMKIRVCNRPFRVGNISGLLDGSGGRSVRGSRLAPEEPLPPLDGGAHGADALAELALVEIEVDLLRGHLEAEEGVDPGEVAAEGGRARGVHRPVARPGADQLEVAI